jgi:arylsulfatase B/arylsulfatase I/J
MQAAMAAALDEGVGNVVALLKKYNFWNNTILAFSSDNGGEVGAMGLNWPLRGGKHTLFEGGVRLLGFVNSPLIKGGHRSGALMHGVDWYPTFVRLASGSFDNSKYPFLDGFDQWDSIVDFANNPSPRKEILHNIDPLAKAGQYDQAAIRVGDWKLLTGNPCGWTPQHHGADCGWIPSPEKGKPIASPPISNTVMLFNITEDPYEKNDVSGKHPAVVNQLLTKLAAYKQGMVPPYQSQVNMNDPKADPRLHGNVYTPWADQQGPVPPSE